MMIKPVLRDRLSIVRTSLIQYGRIRVRRGHGTVIVPCGPGKHRTSSIAVSALRKHILVEQDMALVVVPKRNCIARRARNLQALQSSDPTLLDSLTTCPLELAA